VKVKYIKEKKEFITSVESADISTCDSALNFLQSSMWAEFKSRFDWEYKAFIISYVGNVSCPLLVLSRRLVPGFSFAYIPWGPRLPDNFSGENGAKVPSELVLAELAKKLKPLLAPNTCFIRFDPPWLVADNRDNSFLSAGLKRAAATVQAPDTVHIDLTPCSEEILAQMKSKWRYNISLSEKKEVKIKNVDIQGLEIFYSLLKETAARDGIAVHSFDYYKTLFEICSSYNKNIQIRLYTAVHENDTLAAIMVLFFGDYATYLYGASSNIKRNLMAPYALQWEAMRDAKAEGCKVYDLFGIPPDDNPDHPMAGLYRFKTGFGGQIIHRPASWDYPYKHLLYRCFNFAEAFRKMIRDKKKKR
jgi:lipid II:glycine glycyltransferase (peptidoglycan interpeptide bridge formation enzyme)